MAHAAPSAQAGLDNAIRPKRQITGATAPMVFGIGGGGMTFAPGSPDSIQLRAELTELLDAVDTHEAGVIITIDEVHHGARADLRDLAATYQHLVTEGRNVSLVMAGLPSSISSLLNDDVLTFLRRATPVDLTDVALDDVSDAFRSPSNNQDAASPTTH